MKIVSIAASFIPSNTANSIQVVKASHALAQLGHDVTLIVPGETRMEWDQLQEHYGLKTAFNISWSWITLPELSLRPTILGCSESRATKSAAMLMWVNLGTL